MRQVGAISGNGKPGGAVDALNAEPDGGAKIYPEGKPDASSANNDNGNNLYSHRAWAGQEQIWDAKEQENGILFMMSPERWGTWLK